MVEEAVELAVEGVLPMPAATPTIPMRAGVEVAALGVLTEADTGAAIALVVPGSETGGGSVLEGGLINARGAFGGLNADEPEPGPEGEGGMRGPTRVGPSDGERAGVEADGVVVEADPQVVADNGAVAMLCGLTKPSVAAVAPAWPAEA